MLNTLAPIHPSDCNDDQGSSRQTPRRNHSRAPIKLMRPLLRAKFLQQPHLHSRRSLRCFSRTGKHDELGAGAVNLLLHAPIWLQLAHLLLSDLVWIALVLLCCAALAQRAPELSIGI